MILKFFKYFFWGCLGLFIQIHWPILPVDFFVLTLALAFLALGLGPSAVLALALGLLYGGHSLAPWADWWIPVTVGLGMLRLWKALGDFPTGFQRGLTLSFLLMVQWAWAVAWYGWTPSTLGNFFQVWMGTAVLGVFLLPLFRMGWERVRQWLPQPRRPMGELPLYMRDFKGSRGSRELRRPFGLERG